MAESSIPRIPAGTMVTEYQAQSPPRQVPSPRPPLTCMHRHLALTICAVIKRWSDTQLLHRNTKHIPVCVQAPRPQHQVAVVNHSLDLLFDMDGIDEHPMQQAGQQVLGQHDLELLPDVPPIGVDLTSLHLQPPLQHQQPPMQQQHQQQQYPPMQPLTPQHCGASPKQEQPRQQPWGGPGWQSAPAVAALQQATTPNWQRQELPSPATWIPVSTPAVQYSSSWSGGPHTAPQPVAFGGQPFSGQPVCGQAFGSAPFGQPHGGAGHFSQWGAQGGGGSQQLSSSVPQRLHASPWGGAAAQQGHWNQHQQQQPAPLMYDFGAPPEEQPLSLSSPPRGGGGVYDSADEASPSPEAKPAARRAQPAPPPRRTSARALPRLRYDVFADSPSPSIDGSSPSDTPRSSGDDGDGGTTPASSDGGSPAFGGRSSGSDRFRPSSYSGGGFASTPKAGASSFPARNTPKSLPAGNAFPKSRSGRTVRPHARLLNSPDLSPGNGRGGGRGDPGSLLGQRSGSGALASRPCSAGGPLSKRKRQVQPPAALRDGADFADNQRRKQHNPWCVLVLSIRHLRQLIDLGVGALCVHSHFHCMSLTVAFIAILVHQCESCHVTHPQDEGGDGSTGRRRRALRRSRPLAGAPALAQDRALVTYA